MPLGHGPLRPRAGRLHIGDTLAAEMWSTRGWRGGGRESGRGGAGEIPNRPQPCYGYLDAGKHNAPKRETLMAAHRHLIVFVLLAATSSAAAQDKDKLLAIGELVFFTCYECHLV